MGRSRSRSRKRSRSRRHRKTEKTGRSPKRSRSRGRRRDQKKEKRNAGAAGPDGLVDMPPADWRGPTGPPPEWRGPPPAGWRPPSAPAGWPERPPPRPPANFSGPPGVQNIRPPPDDWHGPGGVPGPRPAYPAMRPPAGVPPGYPDPGYQPPGAQTQGYASAMMDQPSSGDVAATPVIPDELPAEEEPPPATPAERLKGITLVQSVLSTSMLEKVNVRGIPTKAPAQKSLCILPFEAQAAASLQARARRLRLSLARGEKPDFSKPHVPELLPSLNAPGLWKRLRELCTEKGDQGAEVGPPRYELWPSKAGGNILVPRAPEGSITTRT